MSEIAAIPPFKSDTSQSVQGHSAVQVLQWLNWADQDYVAARLLLLRGYLLQGAILANTAIEKYLKAVLTHRSIPFPKGWKGHDVLSLYEAFKSGGAPNLNEDFLRDLGKAYKLRYPDDLAIGFNISLVTVKLLTEFDTTAHLVRRGFTFKKPSGEAVVTRFDELLAEKNSELVDQNVGFGNALKSELFSHATACFELRVMPDGNVMTAEYTAGPISDDHRFNLEGLVPTPRRVGGG
jgi:HEPN domain-containing protein